MEKSSTANRYSAAVRSRAVRMALEHGADHASQWAAIGSIAAKIGCTAETLRGWVRQAERDQGLRAGPSSEERERIKVLERENRELRQANEILPKASAYFAMAELDRRSKTYGLHRSHGLTMIGMFGTARRIDITESTKRCITRGADPKSACHDQDR